MKKSTLYCLSILTQLVVASEQSPIVQQQPHLSPPKNSQFRELVWGDLNFLHTTDTHGRYAGHLNQRQYSGDWGDFISFTAKLRELNDVKGSDLLVVDTGDKHDGNGLSDITEPNGAVSTSIFNSLEYDLVTLGNHELYTEENSVQEYEVSVKRFGDRYVSSNVEFKLDNGTFVPFGSKYRIFRTANRGYRVLALSFLFDFTRFNSRTRVTPLSKVLKQSWFNELLARTPETDIDYIVVFGHIPVTDIEEHELLSLHIHLRRLYPNTPVQYLGGHSHIRDFAVFDRLATGLQSGRYCETVGWISINQTETGVQFNRRFVDFNRESFKHHTGLDDKEFDTPEGLQMTSHIAKMRRHLNLTHSYGYVDRSYMSNRYPYGHPLNVYTLLNSTILPTLQGANEVQSSTSNRLIIVNSGSIRYDLYKGNFTRDQEYIVSPFKNNWNVITLPKDLALTIPPFLNNGRFILQLSTPEKASILLQREKSQEFNSMAGEHDNLRCPDIHKKGLKYGLTTRDDYGCDGDDVVHNSIPYYPAPNIVDSYEEKDPLNDQVDLVFYDFIQPYILEAINHLDRTNRYSERDIHYYGGKSTGVLLRDYFTD